MAISIEEFKQHCNDSDGLCLACGEWGFGGVEPDAEGYECEACGEPQVMGAEQAMIEGKLTFTEE